MDKVGNIVKTRMNIILEGFDPLTAGGFTQIPNIILESKDLTGNAKLCYTMLLRYAWQNDFCFPGQDKLAGDMGVTSRSVRNYLAELKEKGFVSVRRRGLGKTNIYTVYARVKADRKKSSGLDRK